jgi:hypothetical protein
MDQCRPHRYGVTTGSKKAHEVRVDTLVRDYRIVIVWKNGRRSEVSRHRSFIAAERVRASLPTIEACEIRIESMPAIQNPVT